MALTRANSNDLCDLLYRKESGFDRYHSAETSLISLVDHMLLNQDKNRVTGLVFIDYCKAFVMADDQLLLSKIKFYGLCDRSSKWLDSYLSDRQQLVSLAGNNSDYANVPYGVLQGSILGPLLFVLFINDLPPHTYASGADIDLYADDRNITTSAEIGASSKLKESLTITSA